MIPLRLAVYDETNQTWGDTKDLWEIMEPDGAYGATEQEKKAYAIKRCMYPSEVKLTSETYCRDSDRTANYELENITNVNAKAKPSFTWNLLRAEYAQRLLTFLGLTYDYKDSGGNIVPKKAPKIRVTYRDFLGERTIEAYLGQTIEGTLVEYEAPYFHPVTGEATTVLSHFWEQLRIAFPER